MAKKRTEEVQETMPKKKNKTLTIIVIVAVVLVLAAAGAVAWYLVDQNNNKEKGFEKYQFDVSAMEGRIQKMTEEEIQAELNRVVEEGYFNISIASAIVFENPDAEGQARIENIAANNYHMQVDIFLDGTGEKVYSSKLIQPGFSIENIKLDKELAPGEYNATAIFSAITKQEMQLFGTAGAQIRLYVFDHGVMPTAIPTPEPSASPEPDGVEPPETTGNP